MGSFVCKGGCGTSVKFIHCDTIKVKVEAKMVHDAPSPGHISV